MEYHKKIAFPHPPGDFGPGSFQLRFEESLRKEGYHICYSHEDGIPDIIVVIGGTKRIFWLLKMKFKGVPIIYRLDGINWLHRKKRSDLKTISYRIRNWSNKFIHAILADHIIYQSNFVKEWWDMEGWSKQKSFDIIYNGVDLDLFYPNYNSYNPTKLLCLEGNLDYSPYTIYILNQLTKKLPKNLPLVVHGNFVNKSLISQLDPNIKFSGSISRNEVPSVLQNSIYFSLDIHPACPNTVIEALACGVPVVAYNTGSLKELVSENAGKIVDYGSDPWMLGLPDVDNLINGILSVTNNYESYCREARITAENRFRIKDIVTKYISCIEKLIIDNYQDLKHQK